MARFRNNYACPCGARWSDDSNYTNNDRCPECNKETEPKDSDDLETEFDVQNIPLMISARQRDALITGLRNLQLTLNNLGGAVDDLPHDMRDLMTCGGEHSGMEALEIDDLCEEINVGPPGEGESNPVYEKGYEDGMCDGLDSAAQGGEAPARALLQELVAWEAEAWDDDDEIDGGDAVEWLGEFRERVKAFLNAPAPEPAKYLLVMFGDVEPQLRGPFETDEARLAEARDYRRENGDEDGLYKLDAIGPVTVDPFTGGCLDTDEAEG